MIGYEWIGYEHRTTTRPDPVNQARRQIQGLVNEIAQLSRQNVSPGEFYSEFLGRVVSALAAVGGVVWAMQRGGATRPPVSNQSPPGQSAHQRRRPGRPRTPALQGDVRHGRDVGPAALGHRRRRARLQPHRFPPRAGPAADRPRSGRRGRGLSAERHRAGRPSGDICGSSCKCASWPPTSSRAINCGTSPTGRSSGRGWRTSPARSTPRWSRSTRRTRSPTRGGG